MSQRPERGAELELRIESLAYGQRGWRASARVDTSCSWQAQYQATW